MSSVGFVRDKLRVSGVGFVEILVWVRVRPVQFDVYSKRTNRKFLRGRVWPPGRACEAPPTAAPSGGQSTERTQIKGAWFSLDESVKRSVFMC